jgi:hypothetical protein
LRSLNDALCNLDGHLDRYTTPSTTGNSSSSRRSEGLICRFSANRSILRNTQYAFD